MVGLNSLLPRGVAFDAVRGVVELLARGAGAAFFVAFAAAARRGLPLEASRRAFPGAVVRFCKVIIKFPIERSSASR